MDSSLPPQQPDHTARPKSSSSNAASQSPALASVLPARTNSQSGSGHRASSRGSTHRQGFAENLRNPPPSPRSQRHPSFTQQAIQDLVNHPPANRQSNPRWVGRDWRGITLGELAGQDEIRWVGMETSVEEATMTLLKSAPSNVVLIRENADSKLAVSTFDHRDLNTYLLTVVGLAKPSEEDAKLYDAIVHKAKAREAIPLRDIQPILKKNELVKLPATATLDKVVELFGSGTHRVLVTGENDGVVGILSQTRLVEFFWSEAVSFPSIDKLYDANLHNLQIGSQRIIAVNADAPLADALLLMDNEGLTSVAVVDNGLNVVGNISTFDVKLLTSAANAPLLQGTCMHFVSVILSEKGVEKGRDSFPVFYVTPQSTLAHTVAKLVATHSHRMWVVEAPSPSPSAPATPLLTPSLPTTTSGETTTAPGATVVVPPPSSGSTPSSPLPGTGFASVPAAALPGVHLSGRLTGVVSLTDILNLFAKSSGLHPADPGDQRARRRTQSSSSSVRPSLDGARTTSGAIQ